MHGHAGGLHGHAGHEDLLHAVDDDPVARREAPLDHPQTLGATPQADIPPLRRAVVRHHVDILAVLVREHGPVIDQHRLVPATAEQAHPGEQPRREAAVAVVQYRPHGDGAGAARNLAFQEVHPAFMRIAFFAAQPHPHGQALIALAGPLARARHLRIAQEGGFIGFEVQVHGVEGDQRGQHAGRIARSDQIPGGHLGAAGTAVDRRTHAGELQVELRTVQCRLRGLHLGIRLVGGGAPLFDDLRGDGLLRRQALGTRCVVACQRSLAAGAGQLGPGAVILGLVTARIDGEQHIALAHFLAFHIVDLFDVARHPGAQVYPLHRLDTAVERVPVADRLDQHRRGADLGCWRCARRSGMAAFAAGECGQQEYRETDSGQTPADGVVNGVAFHIWGPGVVCTETLKRVPASQWRSRAPGRSVPGTPGWRRKLSRS